MVFPAAFEVSPLVDRDDPGDTLRESGFGRLKRNSVAKARSCSLMRMSCVGVWDVGIFDLMALLAKAWSIGFSVGWPQDLLTAH